MWKHVLARFTPCSSPCALSLQWSSTTSTCVKGEDTEKCPEAAVGQSPHQSEDVRVRRITPTQLSIAVSKRKRKSRASKDSSSPPTPLSVDEGPMDQDKTRKKRFPKTEANGIGGWKLRYDKVSIAERDELVSYVSKKLGSQKSITGPFQDAYTAPSVIGMDSTDIDASYDRLLEVGFTKQDAAAILPYLPSCLVVDYAAVKEMCDLLVEHDIGWRPFLSDHCHCLFYPTAVVRNNLVLMKKMGMTRQVIGHALKVQPLLFMYPLNEKDVETIAQTKDKGFNSMWVDTTVKQALLNRPAKVSLGSDTESIVHILKQFKVSPDFILRRHPSFFSMKAEDLLSILEVLCGEPLFLDNTLIAQILHTCPQHVSSIDSLEELRDHLTSLCDIFTVVLSIQYIIRHMVRTPSLISPSLKVKDKVAVFHDAGFTTKETSVILNRAPSVLTQSVDELKTRLTLLLDLKGSSPSKLSAAASSNPMDIRARFLTNQIQDLQARIHYCKKYNEDFHSINKLDDLFATSDHQFAVLFNKTGMMYLKEAMDEKWINRKIIQERMSKQSHNNNKMAMVKKLKKRTVQEQGANSLDETEVKEVSKDSMED